MRSGYPLKGFGQSPAYIGDLAPTTVALPPGYVLMPAPAPPPITAATGGLNLDWRGEPIQNPLVPVVELYHSGQVSNPTFVPVNEIDSFVGELSDDFDFGLGKLEVQNPEHELGKIMASFNAKATMPKLKFTPPKLSISIGPGTYKKLTPAKKPTRKPPVKAAVRAVAKVAKPLVIARKKTPTPSPKAQGKTLEQIYAQLKAQGKIINLLATKKKLTAEHKRKVGQEGFRENVMDLLRKIEKQCAGDSKGNYFARWNALKKATGVAINQR